jgi:hypothetical protein
LVGLVVRGRSGCIAEGHRRVDMVSLAEPTDPVPCHQDQIGHKEHRQDRGQVPTLDQDQDDQQQGPDRQAPVNPGRGTVHHRRGGGAGREPAGGRSSTGGAILALVIAEMFIIGDPARTTARISDAPRQGDRK